MRIAIIGTGISGLSSALLLDRYVDIDVYEKATRIGGHSNTVDVETSVGTIPVDTGFIVFNPKRYPNLVGMLDYLNVATEESDMSFALSLNGGKMEYEGSLPGLLGQPSNLLSPSYWRMITHLIKFYRSGMAAVHAGKEDETLGEFISRMGYAKAFVDHHLLPLGAAIWSCPAEAMLRFPARSFMAFMENHQLIDFTGRPRWRTVSGGSRQYVQQIISRLKKPIRNQTHIKGLRRVNGGVMLSVAGQAEIWYDRVIMAAHADQSLGLIHDASPQEKDILGAFDFQPNIAVLHSDPRHMPRRRRLWASWNYQTSGQPDPNQDNQLQVTYWMNRLQNIRTDQPLFVTLNPVESVAEDQFHAQFSYDHPVFDQKALAAQSRLHQIQGQNGLYFCGAWTGYGFHEDGLVSAVRATRALGYDVPWFSPTRADFTDRDLDRLKEVPAQ
ncbi:MAG: FAD-dependent oxidoreductase [Alphaproteobacteria bacterium]|nr:FAD-dependent oxidoreductase [Alphaproteobacteria bacterium]